MVVLELENLDVEHGRLLADLKSGAELRIDVVWKADFKPRTYYTLLANVNYGGMGGDAR